MLRRQNPDDGARNLSAKMLREVAGWGSAVSDNSNRECGKANEF